MGNPRILAFAAVALACGACGNNDAPVVAGDPFLGTWSCTETRNLTFTTPSGSPDSTEQTKYSLVVSSSADAKLDMLGKNEAGASCKLNFNEMSKSAVLVSGQSCTESEGIALTYTMGTANIGDPGLQMNLSFDFAGMFAGGSAMPFDAAGSGTIATLCWKVYTGGGAGVGGGGW